MGILVDPGVSARLGRASEVARQLWPHRCQTCGEPWPDAAEPENAADRAVLAVDERATFAIASVHHRRCRPSDWRFSTPISPWGGPYTTVRARLLVLPFSHGGRSAPAPAFVINPSLEHVVLDDGIAGGRQVTLARFEALGMRAPGREQVPTEPVDGARAVVDGDTVTLTLPTPDRVRWSAAVSQRVEPLVGEHSRILAVVTHAVDPGRLTSADDLAPALLNGDTRCGWIALSRIAGAASTGVPAVAPRPSAAPVAGIARR